MRILVLLLAIGIGYYLYEVYSVRKKYREGLEKRGFIKVYICFDDGGYIKGYITKAQYRGFSNIKDIVIKPLNPNGGDKKVQRNRVFYIEVM